MNRKWMFALLCVLVLALALAGCGGGAAQPSAAPAGNQTGDGGGGAASGNQVVITPELEGKSIDMKVGQQLLVKLGAEGNCKVDVTPTFLLNPVSDAALNPGEQGVWEAKMNGQATVQATCDNSKQYNVSVKINPAQ